MDKDDEDLVLTLIGQEYSSALPDNDSGRIKAIRVELRHSVKEYKEIGAPISLEIAVKETLKEGEWWCPVEFDGARWKTYIIPPPWLSPHEWDAHEVTVISKGLNPDEPYGKGFLKMMRDSVAGIGGYLSVSDTDREETLDQFNRIFRMMDGCEDEKTWNLLAMAFRAGRNFSKLFSNEEGKRIARKGFKQVNQQGKGRPKGAANKKNEKKERAKAEAAYQNKQKKIVALWRETSDHNPYAFMEVLVNRGLAKKQENDCKYQLAEKGIFQVPDNCTRKIRGWVKKFQ